MNVSCHRSYVSSESWNELHLLLDWPNCSLVRDCTFSPVWQNVEHSTAQKKEAIGNHMNEWLQPWERYVANNLQLIYMNVSHVEK